MSSSSRAWVVGAVEALKDQGFCRWNHALRLLQTDLSLRSSAHTSKLQPSKRQQRENSKQCQSEESLRKVMYLSCWAPY